MNPNTHRNAAIDFPKKIVACCPNIGFQLRLVDGEKLLQQKHRIKSQTKLLSELDMRRLAKLFDFTGYGCDDDGWCVSVSNIILNHHCRANTMLHRARLIAEIHIINISSVNSFENTAFHKRHLISCIEARSENRNLGGFCSSHTYPFGPESGQTGESNSWVSERRNWRNWNTDRFQCAFHACRASWAHPLPP